jgi:hypothetical protein
MCAMFTIEPKADIEKIGKTIETIGDGKKKKADSLNIYDCFRNSETEDFLTGND